ncbi:hypothetical protein GMMP1_580022 [Candidatus Magnetomoraceae bacterium gMMP-1]
MILNIPKHLIEILNKNPIVAIDVGSRGGIIKFGSLEPFVKAIGFEADVNETLNLQSKIQYQRNFYSCQIEPYAAWSYNGKSTLYICNYLPNCSLLKPNPDYAEKFGLGHAFEVVDTKEVECITIESVLKKSGISAPDYIKIDAQGGDLEVLKGLEHLIKDVLLIRLEVLFVPLYYGAPSIGMIDEYMKSNNFRLLSIESKSPRSIRSRNIDQKIVSDKGELVWGDLIYAKEFESIDNSCFFSEEKSIIFALLLTFEGFESLAADFLMTISRKENISKELADLTIKTILSDNLTNKLKRKLKPFLNNKILKLLRKIK